MCTYTGTASYFLLSPSLPPLSLLVFRLPSNLFEMCPQSAAGATRAGYVQRRDWLRECWNVSHSLRGRANGDHPRRWLAGICVDPSSPAAGARAGGVAGGLGNEMNHTRQLT